MHVLILNFNARHQTQFLKKALRYENVGADTCAAENLLKMWYGQYEAIIIPIASWTNPSFPKIQKVIQMLGKVPTILTSKIAPPNHTEEQIKNDKYIQFISSHAPFHDFVKTLKQLIHQNIQPSTQQKLQIGDLQIDLSTRQAKREKTYIYLRNKEFALLACLMNNADKVLTRTYLLEQVWDRNTSLLSNTVDVHISRLRQKIDCGHKEQMIVTVPCIGYKLVSV